MLAVVRILLLRAHSPLHLKFPIWNHLSHNDRPGSHKLLAGNEKLSAFHSLAFRGSYCQPDSYIRFNQARRFQELASLLRAWRTSVQIVSGAPYEPSKHADSSLPERPSRKRLNASRLRILVFLEPSHTRLRCFVVVYPRTSLEAFWQGTVPETLVFTPLPYAPFRSAGRRKRVGTNHESLAILFTV